MAMAATIPSSNSNNTISTSLSIMENINNSRDVSFSSYLNGAEKTYFIINLTESTQTSNYPTENISIGKNKVQDGHEIGVFSAEKYFQGEIDDRNSRIIPPIPKIHHDKNDPVITHPKTLPGTPSIRSESSWNSQSALLTRSPKKQGNGTTNRLHRRSFLSSIGCNCYCKDKKSVDIDQGIVTTTEIPKKSLSKTWAEEKMLTGKGNNIAQTQEIFSFPILGSSIPTKEDNQINPTSRLRSLSMEIKKKQSVVAWETEEETSENHQNDAFNDNASETSSDLFEIESFSTNTNSYLARESSTCYAPSEASIEWSVVTADYDDTRSNITTAVRNSGVKESQKRKGILPGCKSQKSVSVAGSDVYRINHKSNVDPKHKTHALDSVKFQPDTEFGFDRIRTVSSRTKNLSLF